MSVKCLRGICSTTGQLDTQCLPYLSMRRDSIEQADARVVQSPASPDLAADPGRRVASAANPDSYRCALLRRDTRE
jgi:hypothetical protein